MKYRCLRVKLVESAAEIRNIMNKKSFFLGVVTGVVLTFVGLFAIALVSQKTDNDQVQYLERPVSYENKTKASFKVFQVLGDAALASEASNRIGGDVMYHGNTVMIQGENFYSDQVVTVKNPMRVGTYNYTNKGGMPMTVPVIKGNTE